VAQWNCFVTGGAGFIGSNFVDRLIVDGHKVTVYDNLTTGFTRFLDSARLSPQFEFVDGDLLDTSKLSRAMVGADIVFHFAANADVRFGTEHPGKDLEQNTIATFNVLEAMRATGVKRIAFSSTGSIYGEAKVIPTPEDAPLPIQTSFYGASKIAGEALIEAYCEGFGLQSWIFRFVSVLGPRYTNGHVFDFYKKLLARPDELHVLGNGQQRKSYMLVSDCIDAILLAVERARDKINIFNLGTRDACTVNQSVGWICERLGVNPALTYSGGDRGWIGDNPLILLDTARIEALGWQPKCSIKDGVIRTLDWLSENRWAFERRSERDCIC
jgi:UDP-glucose 4-epimerase